MRLVGFIGPTYTLSSVNVDCQRCINLFPELNELGTGKDKEIASLLGTPGLNLLTTLGAPGGHRGSWLSSQDELFMVVKNKLYKVAEDFTSSVVGTLATIAGPVSMADNGLQLVLVDGPNGYVWDFNLSTFTQISDPAWMGSTQVAYQDGTFLFIKPDSNVWYISGLNEVTFDGADVAEKEGNADNIVAIISDHRNVWLFGDQTTEVWYNSGAALFPYQRLDGAFIETGCAAPFSVAKMNGTVIWLGKDKQGQGIVYEASGYQPVRISNQAVEDAIQSYGTMSDAVAWTYQDGGHCFYAINFPTADTTWVFDTLTKQWHERAYLSDGQLGRHRAETHTYAFGKHIVGDWENGKVYEMTRDALSDAGQEILRRRRALHISSDMQRQFFPSFQLDMETGVGIDGTGQGTDPQVMLRWSDDGGHTWSNEHWASAGKIGHTRARAQWNRLGSSRSRVFEVTITDPVKVVLIGAEVEFMAGVS